MALPAYALPYGLRDVRLKPLDAAEATGTIVDLPAARTFSFGEQESFEDLRGDDVIIATHGSGPNVAWTLESGGISLDALKVIAGGTVTQTGTTPNIIKTYSKLGTDAKPYFQVEGQAISDNGGDLHCKVYKCKADGDIGGDFGDATFFLTGASGRGIPLISNSKLYDFMQNETAVTIT